MSDLVSPVGPGSGAGFSLFPSTSLAPRPPRNLSRARPGGSPSLASDLPVQQPRPDAETLPRSETAFSQAATLVPQHASSSYPASEPASAAWTSPSDTASSSVFVSAASTRLPPVWEPPPDRSERPYSPVTIASTHKAQFRLPPESLQQPRWESQPQSQPKQQSAPAIRSLFPQYNPDLPLAQQPYFPTMAQHNFSDAPRQVVSRMPLRGESADDRASSSHRHGEPSDFASYLAGSAGQTAPAAAATGWRRGVSDQLAPKLPKISSNEQLRGLWKVANGWRASQSEGRVYCLRLAQESDAPVYTLSSATQPFYHLRVDPTSAAARVMLKRHDPAKPYRPSTLAASNDSASNRSSGGGGRSTIGIAPIHTNHKNWHEALTTVLEKRSRPQEDDDGLVALLYPAAACRVALARPDDAAAVELAERECARMVWDGDSASHYVVHPVLATPFCITIDRTPSWSRVCYTLEHPESPLHVARLTRDGTGSGWLEIDTRLAALIESCYLVDVAVTALLLVAASDDKFARIEPFQPPPAPNAHARSDATAAATLAYPQPAHLAFDAPASRCDSHSSRLSRWGGRLGRKPRDHEFELDEESQRSSFAKTAAPDCGAEAKKHSVPWLLRALWAVMVFFFKAIFWCIGLVFRALAKCLGLN